MEMEMKKVMQNLAYLDHALMCMMAGEGTARGRLSEAFSDYIIKLEPEYFNEETEQLEIYNFILDQLLDSDVEVPQDERLNFHKNGLRYEGNNLCRHEIMSVAIDLVFLQKSVEWDFFERFRKDEELDKNKELDGIEVG